MSTGLVVIEALTEWCKTTFGDVVKLEKPAQFFNDGPVSDDVVLITWLVEWPTLAKIAIVQIEANKIIVQSSISFSSVETVAVELGDPQCFDVVHTALVDHLLYAAVQLRGSKQLKSIANLLRDLNRNFRKNRLLNHD